MTKMLLLLTLSLLAALPLRQDVQVATWSTGTPDTGSYESLAFWIKDGHRAYIRYLHGNDADDVELKWLGPDSAYGHRGFKAGFPAPDSRILFIAPVGDSLLIVTGGQRRKFHWENENGGPDSTGTCDICAHSVKEANSWLRQYFWQ